MAYENCNKLSAGYQQPWIFDKQYIHVDQRGTLETSPLDKQALVDKINTLDTDTYGLPKKDLWYICEVKLAQMRQRMDRLDETAGLARFPESNRGYNSRVHQVFL